MLKSPPVGGVQEAAGFGGGRFHVSAGGSGGPGVRGSSAQCPRIPVPLSFNTSRSPSPFACWASGDSHPARLVCAGRHEGERIGVVVVRGGGGGDGGLQEYSCEGVLGGGGEGPEVLGRGREAADAVGGGGAGRGEGRGGDGRGAHRSRRILALVPSSGTHAQAVSRG